MRAIVASVIVLLGLFGSALADDEGDYGPDWPVCRNVRGEPNQEIDACRRLIDGNVLSQKHLSWAYNNMATAYSRLKRLDLAIANFEKAMQIDPANHAPYFNVGDLFYRAGHLDEALQLYDKGLALKSDMPDGYCKRGRVLEALQRFDEAQASYEKELARDPNDDCALYSYVEAAEARHEEQKAIVVLDRALQANPNDAESYHRRGSVYFGLEQYDRALADLEMAVKLNPRDLKARLARSETYRELGRYDEAIADAGAVISLRPDFLAAYDHRADAEFLKGDYTSAAADCDLREKISPEGGSCMMLDWHISMLTGKFEAAAGSASALIDAHASVGLLYRGGAEFGAGKMTEAARDFEQYVAAVPDDPYGWLWLYLADRNLGKNDLESIRPIASKRDAWPNPVLRHIVGLASVDDVLAAADVPDERIKRERLAEANYYLGALSTLDGHPDVAMKLYQASIDAGRVELSERQSVLVYKVDADLERALANAALHGQGL